MVLLKRFFTGFFPNDPEELPVRTTPSVTQNNASRSWGGAGLSVHEEAVAVLAWSQCQTLLQCMCTYVCTLWCVCMCVLFELELREDTAFKKTREQFRRLKKSLGGGEYCFLKPH